MISQLFDLLTAVASSSRCQNALKEILPQLINQTLGMLAILSCLDIATDTFMSPNPFRDASSHLLCAPLFCVQRGKVLVEKQRL